MRIIEWTPRHARLLAELWNASDAGWPSGLVRLRPKTVPEALEWERRQASLGRFLALEGRRPIGYARMFEWWGSPDATYVQWLNVDPRYQGKGVGKALLRKAIERTVALGYDRVDLHTWPGNDKARPLYKRLGWMWVPASHAYLQNYVPLILRYEPAKAFFAKRDWSSSFHVDVERDFDEDDVRGTDAFVYRFRAGRARLEVAIDRSARGVMAFEDASLRVEAWIPKGAVEREHREVRWFARNKSRMPVRVRFEPTAPAGVRVSTPRPVRLAPGASREVRGTIHVRRGFRNPPEKWASAAVETAVVVGDHVIRLRSGFRAKPAVSIALDGRTQIPAPGSARIVLVVRNGTGRRIRGILGIRGRGLRTRPDRVPLRLSKGGSRRVAIDLTNADPRARAVPLRVRFRGGRVDVSKTVALPCLPPGGTVGYRDGEALILESAALRFASDDLGGFGSLRTRDDTALIRSLASDVGPPFWPSEVEKTRWRGRISSDGVPEIVRTVALRRRPGIVVESRWRLLSDRLIEDRRAVENRGREAQDVRLATEIERGIDHPAITFATRLGVSTEAAMENEWPDTRKDVPLDRLLAEDWIHIADEECGYGVVWTAPRSRRAEIEISPWVSPLWFPRSAKEGRLRPGERREFDPVLLLATRDWREVRALWAQASGRRVEDAPARTGSLRLELDPGLVLASPAARLRATLRNERRRPASGTARFEVPGAKASRWRVGNLDIGRSWTRDVRVPALPVGPATGRFVLESPGSVRSWDVPILSTDGRGRVSASGPPRQRAVANGALRFVASTAHGGSLTSLRAGGKEFLVSSYPTPRSFSWFRPFHGGISPFAFTEDWPGNLYRERFRIRGASRGTWSGVRLVADTRASDLPKGLRIELEYLTRPGSPLVAFLLTARNGSRDRLELKAGFWAFLGLNRKPIFDAEFERLGSRRWGDAGWSRWTAADDGFAVYRAPGAPRCVVLVAARPASLEVVDLRDDGRHGLVADELDLRPRASGTILGVLAVAKPDAARDYRVLRNASVASFDATRPR
ncbi:MAG: hypothetical protein A3K66_06210 [Euryarchaeota archaeon RBG_16_67_27]|nr:MAG: hypothetical protein A3K66_06210 [Euryarchaeota archaeon RBG_16_67_27]